MEDVFRLLAALEREPDWAGRIDWARVAFIGHAQGACAALSLASSRQGWPPGGAEIKAVVAMSPGCDGPLAGASAVRAVLPAMIMDGAPLFALAPVAGKPVRSVRHTTGRTVQVTLGDAGRTAWTDQGTAHHAAIIKNARAFLGVHLKAPAAAGEGGGGRK